MQNLFLGWYCEKTFRDDNGNYHTQTSEYMSKEEAENYCDSYNAKNNIDVGTCYVKYDSDFDLEIGVDVMEYTNITEIRNGNHFILKADYERCGKKEVQEIIFEGSEADLERFNRENYICYLWQIGKYIQSIDMCVKYLGYEDIRKREVK